jgi:hypothetical protein
VSCNFTFNSSQYIYKYTSYTFQQQPILPTQKVLFFNFFLLLQICVASITNTLSPPFLSLYAGSFMI